MRFSFVLAVVAAVIASISASPVDSRSDAESSGPYCPSYCTWLTCCLGFKCEWVAIFNDWRGRRCRYVYLTSTVNSGFLPS
ncbi:uncharacterized protein EDB91DRAFT_1158649 [Suillus paluster]|uniref:uncharacterized protein n=1 Tax=Suillus paluster TaxID=48578 RepID=UPI001B8729D5|nr:uncharacterized protein EDB91DRAFT_1176095 [Suillus paluster]XP_041172854.1 uncharacterized protein EDB91DRAFT_1158649 [Suillus paluster]KAG1721592.1 hypothetical protein EDB91DRAFT_1176095 [Suillus paluster]KAG1729986.1 hypothetical protein EDB91DRAFT_1158649 [Suillus paluster]